MLKLLLKKQLLEIFRSYYYDAKKNKARSKAATIAYIAMFAVLMVVVLGGIFTLLSVKMCAPMAQAGMGFFGYMGCLAGLNLILCALLYLWLKKKGSARFAEL